MPHICGCIGNKSSDSMKLHAPSGLCWPWKRQQLKITDKRPISLGTQVGDSFDFTDGDLTTAAKTPPIARGESVDQDSLVRRSSRDTVEKSSYSHVNFHLHPTYEGPLCDITKRNQSWDAETGDFFPNHKHMEAPCLTYPTSLDFKWSRASARTSAHYVGASNRRGSLIVRTHRPLPGGLAPSAANEPRMSGVSFSANPPPNQINITQDTHGTVERFLDDTSMVTPYARILAGLRSVQTNISWLTSKALQVIKVDKPKDNIQEPQNTDTEEFDRLASSTQKELEWCLQQLESIQTKRPVSDMASTKFKRLLSQKLGSFNTTDKARNQISEYISKTFMDEYSNFNDDVEEDSAFKSDASEKNKSITTQGQHIRFSFGSSTAAEEHSSQLPPKQSIASGKASKIPRTSSFPTFMGDIPVLEPSDPVPYHGCATPNDEQLNEVFAASVDVWGLDLFEVDELSGKHALSTVAYRIFSERNLFNTFNINPSIFVNYILRLEASYLATNPYHNHVHAADVLQSVHVLLKAETLEGVFSDLEILSSLFASAIHDVHHLGLTNQFLINTGHKLALLYNDVSVLENHHLSVAFKLLNEPGCDIFENLSPKHRQTLRRLVIELVLATDMSKHMNLLAELRTMVETKELTGSGFLNLDDHNDRSLVLQCMIHCADLSNPAKPFPLYKKWTYRVMEEFFGQGDKEKELGIEVSAMCDRDSVCVDKIQIGFIDFVVHPLYECWCDLVHPAAERLLETLDTNRDTIHAQCPFKEFEESVKSKEADDCLSKEATT